MRSVHASPLVLLCAALTLLPLPAAADEYIRIASWNVEHLGHREWGQHPEALADHILLAGADLLVLQEIYDTDDVADTRRNAPLDAALAIVDRHPGQDWEYELFPKREEDATHQLVGVAWNRERLTRGGSFRIPVEYASEKTWRRQPYGVSFSTGAGKTDFVVVPLHMKSNFDGEDVGREARAHEAHSLIEKLPLLRAHFGSDGGGGDGGEEGDVILIGDTNCLEGAEPAIGLYEDAGFRDLNDADVVTYRKGSYASPFDRILIPLGESEFRYSRQYVLAPADPSSHLARLSDHFVVMMTMRVLEDDDP
jgi:endonuclease/exonuclease/phosphatase family metal-dependent hydrolase